MPEESVSLAEKEQLTKQRLHALLDEHPPSRVFVAWTGGKDSTVVLWLWIKALETSSFPNAHPRALRLQTGLEFPEVLEFCRNISRQWQLEDRVATPGSEKMPRDPGADPVSCCGSLKIEPLRQGVRDNRVEVLLTGLRGDEHPDRGRSLREQRQDPDYLQVNPILEWTEMDVWSYILQNQLPYCRLYEQGYRSLDCRPCTGYSELGERGGRNQEKERQLELLRSLGYF